MGLDMYLSAKRYIYRAEEEELMEPVKKTLLPNSSHNFRITTVSAEVAYWRKANAIHKWFVDNVQSGNDNCGEYYVSREDLESLRETCQKALDNKDSAGNIMPTQSGFFFGETTIDSWYFENLEYTINQINIILESEDLKHWDFYYHSSW
jgi:hypothetical protein